MAEKLTFKKFADLVLARTAEAEKQHGASVFFSVHDLMADLVDHIDDQWPWQAAKHLEEQGLVKAAGQVVLQSGSFSSEEVTELLDEAEERLRASDVPQAQRDEVLADVESAKAQLKKQRPSVAVLKTTVEALRAVGVAADVAEKLDHLIG